MKQTIDDRYATCIKCAYAISWFENSHFRFTVNCPRCHAKDQFGPGVYVEDFEGYTWDEVIQYWKNIRVPAPPDRDNI